MPQAASITVKKADGTTDIVYGLIQPASGSQAAIWRAPGGSAIAHQPMFSLAARENQARTVTRMKASMMYPEIATNSTTGITSVVNTLPFTCELVLAKNAANLVTKEAIYQFGNLLVASLIRQCFEQQSSAT